MRKFFITLLVSYLTLIYAPLTLASYDCGGGETYESAAEACYLCGAGCEDTTDEAVDAYGEAFEAEEAAEGGSDATDTTSTPTTTVEVAPQGLDWLCPFTSDTSNVWGFTAQIDTSAADQAAEQKKADEAFEAWEKEYSSLYEGDISASTCGKPNASGDSLFLEKGDCSAAGKVITEITEVIAPDVTLDDNEIVTVYAGLCCFYRITDSSGNFISCEETVTLYAKDYSTCNSYLASCEKRQWVIGSSGIGIVKLMVKQIFTFGALAVGSIAVSTIVFQGIKISVSGVSGDITESKNKILQAIAGIVLLFLSGLILYAINPTFFG